MPKLHVVSGWRLIAILKKVGFQVVRQKGSHVSLRKITPQKIFQTVVPLHRELSPGTLLDILKQSGMTKGDLAKQL